MKELINQWFEQSSPFQGILACGIRHPDQSGISKVWSDGFTEIAVENAMRCVADFFQVLQLNRLPPGRVRWSYARAFLYCERRADGTCIGFFTLRESESVDLDGLERMVGEFQTLAQAAR